MIIRLLDLARKAWLYLLAGLESPLQLPLIVWQVITHRVHLGELLRLNRHRVWLRSAGITTLLDVGANTGQFASAFRVVLPTAHIYSFEPLPDCCQRLRRKLSPRGRFEAFNVALGNTRGEMTFSRNEFTEASSLLPLARAHQEAFPWAANVQPVTVRVERLDALADQLQLTSKVLLKIDVQGYELEVLHGARATMSRVDFILVEISFRSLYDGQPPFEDVYACLRTAGFVYAGSFDQLLSPVDSSILQADALFVRA